MVCAVQRSAMGFEASYRRHLANEQRRAVLEALATSFEPNATVGEIVDAAAALGWAEVGELSLADLAEVLLVATPSGASSAPQDDDDADDDDDDADEAPALPTRGTRRLASPAPPSPAKPTAAKPKRGETASAKAAVAKPAATKIVTKLATKPAKPKSGKPAKVALDDRMSLDEAAGVLLPLIRQIGEATMQQLEQSTAGAGRRKLRFHIGQLVKSGRLERHGMGRGTFYTVA